MASSGGFAASPDRSSDGFPLPPVLWQLRHVFSWMAGTAFAVKLATDLHPPVVVPPPSAAVAFTSAVNSIFICAPVDHCVSTSKPGPSVVVDAAGTVWTRFDRLASSISGAPCGRMAKMGR